jgi:hypothetical protein
MEAKLQYNQLNANIEGSNFIIDQEVRQSKAVMDDPVSY